MRRARAWLACIQCMLRAYNTYCRHDWNMYRMNTLQMSQIYIRGCLATKHTLCVHMVYPVRYCMHAEVEWVCKVACMFTCDRVCICSKYGPCIYISKTSTMYPGQIQYRCWQYTASSLFRVRTIYAHTPRCLGTSDIVHIYVYIHHTLYAYMQYMVVVCFLWSV